MILALKNYLYLMLLFGAGWSFAWYGAGRELRRLMGSRFVANFAIMTFAGFFAPNVWLYHLVAMVTLVLTVRTREEAISRYVVLIALSPALNTVLQLGGVYIDTFQGVTSLSLAAVIAVASKSAVGNQIPVQRGWRAEDLLIVLLFLVFSVGMVRFDSPTVLLRSLVVAAVDLLLPYWLIRRYVRSSGELERVIGCVAFSALPIALIAIFEAKRRWLMYALMTKRLTMIDSIEVYTQVRGNSQRAMVAFVGPLLLALFLMIAYLAFLCSRQLFRKRLVWQAGLGLLTISLLAPQSRGMLLALVPALIVLLLARRRLVAAAGLLAASGLGAAALFALKKSSSAIGAFVGGNQAGIYYDYRGLLLHRGLQEGMRHPLLGQSYNRMLASLSDISQGEHIVDLVNTYLTIFLLGGLVAIVPFAVCTAIMLRKLIARAPRGAELKTMRSNRAFMLSALTGSLVNLYSISFIERVEVYLAVLLALARLCSGLLVRDVPVRPPAAARAVPAAAAELVPA